MVVARYRKRRMTKGCKLVTQRVEPEVGIMRVVDDSTGGQEEGKKDQKNKEEEEGGNLFRIHGGCPLNRATDE